MSEYQYGPKDDERYLPYTPERRVYDIAMRNGADAAAWIFDGNTTRATYEKFLKGIHDGDPEVMDSVRTPSLSGEFAGDYSEDELMSDIGWVPNDGTDMRDELAEQYNQEVSEAFWAELERIAVNAVHEGETQRDKYQRSMDRFGYSSEG